MLFQFKEYALNVNENSTDVAIIKPILQGNEYDKHLTISSNDVWLDIGAHVGAFSLRYAERVDYIYAYEPCPLNYALLLKNLARYDIISKRIQEYEIAIIGNDDIMRVLSMSTGKDRTSGSLLDYKRRTETYEVVCVNLVDEMSATGATSIKMDIEGSEYECIVSLPINVMKNLRELIFEFHFNMPGEVGTGEKYFELIAHLKQGFKTVTFPKDIKKYWNCIVHASNL